MIRRIVVSVANDEDGVITEPPERELDIEVIDKHAHLALYRLALDGTRTLESSCAVNAESLDRAVGLGILAQTDDDE